MESARKKEPEFGRAYWFEDGLARVWIGDKRKLIDKEGKFVNNAPGWNASLLKRYRRHFLIGDGVYLCEAKRTREGACKGKD